MLVNVLVGAALLLVVGLSVYAFSLQRQVWAREAVLKAQEEALEKEGQEQRVRINRSIQIIAEGAIEGQLSLTEASIRIKVLLDSLALENSIPGQYQAFYELALATDHIPILEAWKALSTKEQREFDKQRLRLEQQHGDAVLDASKRIKGQVF